MTPNDPKQSSPPPRRVPNHTTMAEGLDGWGSRSERSPGRFFLIAFFPTLLTDYYRLCVRTGTTTMNGNRFHLTSTPGGRTRGLETQMRLEYQYVIFFPFFLLYKLNLQLSLDYCMGSWRRKHTATTRPR